MRAPAAGHEQLDLEVGSDGRGHGLEVGERVALLVRESSGAVGRRVTLRALLPMGVAAAHGAGVLARPGAPW